MRKRWGEPMSPSKPRYHPRTGRRLADSDVVRDVFQVQTWGPSNNEVAREFLNYFIAQRGLAPHSVEDGCKDATHLLFSEIYDLLGKETAWQIFGEFKPPSPHKRKWLNDRSLLDRYDWRHAQGWGIDRIVKEIAEDNAEIKKANKPLPRAQRKQGIGNGSISIGAIKQAIKRARKARQKIIDRRAPTRGQTGSHGRPGQAAREP
jgi:hypothetical protein